MNVKKTIGTIWAVAARSDKAGEAADMSESSDSAVAVLRENQT